MEGRLNLYSWEVLLFKGGSLLLFVSLLKRELLLEEALADGNMEWMGFVWSKGDLFICNGEEIGDTEGEGNLLLSESLLEFLWLAATETVTDLFFRAAGQGGGRNHEVV